MSEPRIGRLVVATLHQAIAEVLPLRLEFYENWLKPLGLLEQGRQIGVASFSAALSFLRREEPSTVYEQVARRTGVLAAEWTFGALPWTTRQWIRVLPAPLRLRAALRLARTIARTAYPGTKLSVRVARTAGHVEVRGSVFCQVRESVDAPLCGFYAGLIERLLAFYGIAASVAIERCRASGGQVCALTLAWQTSEARAERLA
jgi:hypothetical protein